MNRLRVAIAGGSGYVGGELARLLLFHPQVELTQVASSSHAGHYLHSVHPNLRRQCSLRFCHPDDLTLSDVLFLCLPHGTSAREIERYQNIAPRIIDLSADFRLRSAALYEQWYGEVHPAPHLLAEAVYGLPELHRAELPDATLVSGTGLYGNCGHPGVGSALPGGSRERRYAARGGGQSWLVGCGSNSRCKQSSSRQKWGCTLISTHRTPPYRRTDSRVGANNGCGYSTSGPKLQRPINRRWAR